MSELIIGYVGADRVYMAEDSHCGKEERRTVAQSSENFGVHAFPGGVLCGFQGFRNIQTLLLSHPEWLDTTQKIRRVETDEAGKKHVTVTRVPGELNLGFIANHFLPQLYRGLKDNDLLEHEDRGDSLLLGEFLLAQNNRLYSIDSSFHVQRVEKYAAIGFGSSLAMPRLLAYDGREPAEPVLYAALRDVAQHHRLMMPPYRLYSTKCPNGQVMEGYDDCFEGN